MTPNETLRAMLDERGVEWEAFDDFEQTTRWSTHNGAFVYWARAFVGKLLIETTAPTKCSASCTPEQAIAATLGAGTCHDIGTFKSWGLFTCSNCSVVFPLNAIREAPSVGKVLPPRFCPNCGREVVDE